jgi:glycosyltransferase involved in cell wall biosynthesis
MIVAIIRGRNAEQYVQKCIESLCAQTYKDWRALICLDQPTDNTYAAVTNEIAKGIGRGLKNDIVVEVNKKNLGLTANMVEAIQLAAPEEEDIIAIVDLDDWLSKRAFGKVAKTYEKHPDCLMTYGSYIKVSKGAKTKRSREYKDGSNVRKAYWQASHLKTFKYKLYRHVPDEYFRDKRGGYIPVASDVALTIPLLELAGLDRARFIGKPIYYWRDKTPYRTNRKKQIRWEKYIRSKKPLERIEQP